MGKNLLENFWTKTPVEATALINKALRSKTVEAIGEARKQVAADMFGELDEAGVMAKPAPTVADKDRPSQAKYNSMSKQDKWNAPMPWPKEKGNGMKSASAISDFGDKKRAQRTVKAMDEAEPKPTKKKKDSWEPDVCGICGKPDGPNHKYGSCFMKNKEGMKSEAEKPKVDTPYKGSWADQMKNRKPTPITPDQEKQRRSGVLIPGKTIATNVDAQGNPLKKKG